MSTATDAPTNLAKILEQVRNMIAKADHPNTPPAEAEMCRNRAEALMLRYRIDAAMAAGDGGESAVTPGWRSIDLVTLNNDFEGFYRNLAGLALAHVDCTGAFESDWHKNTLVLHAVGYEGDLAFADLLITSVQQAFARHLQPQYDPNESDAANAYRLRAGGWTRARIGVVLFGNSESVNAMKAKNRKVTALIKAEGERSGEGSDHLLGRGNDIDTYRKSFAQGFYETLAGRLYRMMQARGEEGAVVLAGRKQAVIEALYERYPHLRPKPTSERVEFRSTRGECPKCQAAKGGYCREHNWLRPRAVRPQSTNLDGVARGRAAARTVDLGAQTGRIGG